MVSNISPIIVIVINTHIVSLNPDTTWCDKVCQWLAAGLWFSPGTLVFSTNKTDRHNITEILLKVALNTTTLTHMVDIGHWLTFLAFTHDVVSIMRKVWRSWGVITSHKSKYDRQCNGRLGILCYLSVTPVSDLNSAFDANLFLCILNSV